MTLSNRQLFVIGVFVGQIGAAAQALLLYHELMNSLPYKAMSLDVHFIYHWIARTGAWASIMIPVLLAIYFGRKTLWLSVILPVVMSPLVFAATFKTYSVIYGLDSITGSGDFTPLRAAQQFYSECLSLIGLGLAVGSIPATILWYFAKRTATEHI